jgi:hypothetical protein
VSVGRGGESEGRKGRGGGYGVGTLPSFLFSQEDQFSVLRDEEEEEREEVCVPVVGPT